MTAGSFYGSYWTQGQLWHAGRLPYESAMISAKLVIAIVDDDAGVRRALHRLVLSLSCAPVTFASGEAFLESLREARPHCVIMDLHLPGLKGIDVLKELRNRAAVLPVSVITGLDQPGMREQCLEAGATVYLTKPIARSTVSSAIEAATAGLPPSEPT